nr:hypothetical protein [Tanacetum cinerariifolium]
MQLSKVMTDKPEESLLEVIHKTRVQSLRRIAELILQSLAEGTKNVNYADKHCIITSHKKASNEDDVQLINQFGLPFLMNTLEAKGTTKKAYCRHAIQLFEEHSCIYCINESKDKEADPSTSPTMAVPTTEDESLTD